jgi:hypothetical protein
MSFYKKDREWSVVPRLYPSFRMGTQMNSLMHLGYNDMYFCFKTMVNFQILIFERHNYYALLS